MVNKIKFFKNNQKYKIKSKMFAETLIHSEEKIFLEAIDQYFESESFDNINPNNKPLFIENDYFKNNENEKESVSQIDKQKENDIEIMNIKFYEALNSDNNEVKDISTDLESEDNNSNNEKQFIKISDFIILNKDAIDKNKETVFNEYKKQLILEEKIKMLFKKDDIKEKNINSSDLDKENKKDL